MRWGANVCHDCRSGDFLRTITDAEEDMQLFWEAFPAEGGQARTFYMFAYCDADRRRPSLEAMLDRFFRLLPQYSGVGLSQLQFKRILFAGLPSYSDGPLRPAFDRILQVQPMPVLRHGERGQRNAINEKHVFWL